MKILANKEVQNSVPNFDIIDIRHDAVEISLKDEILSSLNPQSGLKSLPTMLLYDERGLQLFEEVRISYWTIKQQITLNRSHICKNITSQMQRLMSLSTLLTVLQK
jgi:hypothetical protein